MRGEHKDSDDGSDDDSADDDADAFGGSSAEEKAAWLQRRQLRRRRRRRRRWRRVTTFAICCGVAVLDRADQMLLPAAYYEVARAFDGELSPTTLGLITLGRGVATSLVALPAAVLSNRFHRCRVVAGGALLW